MLSMNQDNPLPFEGDHHEDVGMHYFEPGSLDGGLPEAADDGLCTDDGLCDDDGLCTEYPGAACIQGYGKTALDLFDEDQFSDQRRCNLFYPWALKVEWELTQYLLKSPLFLADIDEFLKLELVRLYTSQFGKYLKLFRSQR